MGSIWYHGTSEVASASILEEGFHAQTYFTPELATALSQGGPYIFSIWFDEDPSLNWQWFTPVPIPPSRIISLRKFNVDVLWYNEKEDLRTTHGACKEIAKSQGHKDFSVCTNCNGCGQLLTKEEKALYLLPNGTYTKPPCRTCSVCKGYGYLTKS